jgi:hypothetical protein
VWTVFNGSEQGRVVDSSEQCNELSSLGGRERGKEFHKL